MSNKDEPVTIVSTADRKRVMLETLARNIALGMAPKDAARDAGYSETCIRSTIYRTMRGEKFQGLLKKHILQANVLQLPKYLKLDEVVIDAALRKAQGSDDAAIAVAAKVQPAAKRKFAMAGLLKEPDEARNPTINIDSVQNLMFQLNQMPGGPDKS